MIYNNKKYYTTPELTPNSFLRTGLCGDVSSHVQILCTGLAHVVMWSAELSPPASGLPRLIHQPRALAMWEACHNLWEPCVDRSDRMAIHLLVASLQDMVGAARDVSFANGWWLLTPLHRLHFVPIHVSSTILFFHIWIWLTKVCPKILACKAETFDRCTEIAVAHIPSGCSHPHSFSNCLVRPWAPSPLRPRWAIGGRWAIGRQGDLLGKKWIKRFKLYIPAVTVMVLYLSNMAMAQWLPPILEAPTAQWWRPFRWFSHFWMPPTVGLV